MDHDLTSETVELLQVLIRNRCVNDGTADSGFEGRNADVLETYVEGAGVDLERWEPTPGRASFVARHRRYQIRSAPSLCLMGHTDVVPVEPGGVEARSVRRRGDRRRGVGPGRGRHAEPDGVDGGRVPVVGAPRVPAEG